MAALPQVNERLRKILRGAFAGPPTQLKDIPTRKGESRRLPVARKPKNKRRKNRAQADNDTH